MLFAHFDPLPFASDRLLRRQIMLAGSEEPLHDGGVRVNRLIARDVLVDCGFRCEDAIGEMGKIRIAGGRCV